MNAYKNVLSKTTISPIHIISSFPCWNYDILYILKALLFLGRHLNISITQITVEDETQIINYKNNPNWQNLC